MTRKLKKGGGATAPPLPVWEVEGNEAKKSDNSGASGHWRVVHGGRSPGQPQGPGG